jgi:UPF0042 nucleotide-binding protein
MSEEGTMSRIRIVTFAVKHGKPEGCVNVMDLRKKIRNPWKVKELKGLTGKDERVQAFVSKCFATPVLMKNLNSLASAYALSTEYPARTLAIGCSNGKQRSVALAEMLRVTAEENGIKVEIEHRDLERT